MFPGTNLVRGAAFTVLSLSLATSVQALPNSGFEDGLTGWMFTAAEQVVVTDGDDGSDYGIYAEEGIQVDALTGGYSALLGRPDYASGRQNRGWNEVTSSPFVADSGELVFSFRAFSFEHRNDDRLRFRIISETGDDLSAVRFDFEQITSYPGSRLLESVTTICSQGPTCDMFIDVGNKKSGLFDSGQYAVTVTGLPTQGEVRLQAGVELRGNSSKATWMYLDDLPAPPVAVIRVNPGDTPDLPALEGDFVVADCLQSGGPVVGCSWVATGGGWDTPRTATGDIAFFWFPDNEPVNIELTVSTADGTTDVTSRPIYIVNAEPAVNAVSTEVLAGTTGETICRYLDAGIGRYNDDGPVPGSEETHSLSGGVELGGEHESQASFSSGFYRIEAAAGGGDCRVIDGDGGVGSDSYNVVEVEVADLPTRLGDDDRIGGVGGNETIETAFDLEVDWKYLGVLADPQDIDVFRIVRSGASLPTGSELVITLEGQPADYDLLVFSNGGSTEASPFFNAPFFNAPFFNAPFFNAPFFNAPFFNAQFNSVPFFNAPFFNAPFFNAPFFNAPVKKSPFFNASGGTKVFNRRFDELPLSEVGLAAPDGSNVSGSDISVTEVGSLSLKNLQATEGISLKAMSAEPGLNAEKVLVQVGPGETEIYVAVVGSDLSFSATSPYGLTIEASTPPSQAELLADTGFCDGEPANVGVLVDSADPGTYLYGDSWSAPSTGDATASPVLILTQRERFETEQAQVAQAAVTAGDFVDLAAYWANFWAKVDEYAGVVGGTVVSVDGGLFEAADKNPCSIAIRNALVTAIRDTYIIDGSGVSPQWRNGALESVVIIGGQNIIPPMAVPDETVVGNERDFTTDLMARPGTPLAVTYAEGYNQTDAIYGDLQTTPFRGRELYLEDRPVGRLVESSEDVIGELNAFLARYLGAQQNSGRIAFGYDFFCDGNAEVAQILGVTPRSGPPCDGALPWTASELTDQWLNGGSQMCLAPGVVPLELANVDMHMSTYGGLSAAGFLDGLATGNYDDVVYAGQADMCLDGTLTTSIGCHSGLNIPDGWALSQDIGLPFDPARDWVQGSGFMVAPWGYGLGDNTVSNRGTEGIMTLMMEELANGSNVGTALITAKRRYVMGLRELDVHDEDSLINLGLFGPPQLEYALTPAMVANMAAQSASSPSAASAPAGSLDLIVRENNSDGSEDYLVGSSSGPDTYDMLRFDDMGGRGAWFEIFPGDGQATYGRTLQPVTLPLEDREVNSSAGDTRIHGVAMVSRDVPEVVCPADPSRSCNVAAVFSDLEDVDGDGLADFNGVMPLPQHDWVVYADNLDVDSILEPNVCVEALAPTQLGVASTLDTGERVSQSLVIGAGQFRCEPGETRADAPGQVVGQQRLYSQLEMVALHPVGDTDAQAQIADTDFDPPQVLTQTVVADPVNGDITAIVKASDALTGGTGISEIIALVYWDEDDTPAGVPGIIESYSAVPVGALTAEPFSHTFVMENARDQRVAFQYRDGAGNLTVKSQKGTLIRAIDVQILSTEIDLISPSLLSVFIEAYCSLEAPTVSYSLDGGEPVSFTLDNPPPGVTITDVESENTEDPAAPCDATITVEGIDFTLSEYGQTAELTVEIRAPGAIGSDTETISTPEPITINLPLLPSGTAGVAYPDQVFSATGGVVPYTWALTSGALPPGLALTQANGQATVSGALSDFLGSPYEFTLTVTDAGGESASQDLSIAVAPPPLAVTTNMLPQGRVGDAYSASLTATGGSGGDLTWTVNSGALPAGLTLQADGTINGTPTDYVGSPFAFTATLTDADADVAPVSVTLSIEVAPSPLVITTDSLPDARKSNVYSETLQSEGGSGSVTWSVTGGSLPNGVRLTSDGTLTGKPNGASFDTYYFTVTATDANSAVAPATKDLSMRVTCGGRYDQDDDACNNDL